MITIKKLWKNPLIKGQKRKDKELFLLLKIGAKSETQFKRKPVNVTFVIDRSGSMSSLLDDKRQRQRYMDMIKEIKINKQNNDQKKDIYPNNPYTFPFNPDPYIQYGIGTGNPPISMQHCGNITSMSDPQLAQKILTDIREDVQKLSLSKLDLVKKATIKAIESLNDDDIVSIVSFGNDVKVLCSGEFAKNKTKLIDSVNQIRSDGMTNLFDGWWHGARCVAENMKPGFLNRVVLLTDGQANIGKTDPTQITHEISKLVSANISTTTFGVGDDYNEDLLQKIAEKGEGNYYYIKDDKDFLELFTEEFNDINNIFSKRSKLKILTALDYNVITEIEKSENSYKLNSILNHKEKEILISFKLNNKNSKIKIELEYERDENIEIFKEDIIIPVVSKNEDFEDQEVIDKIALINIAKEKQKAMEELDKGNVDLARRTLINASAHMSGMSSASVNDVSLSLNNLTSQLDSGNFNVVRKTAKYESYNMNNSKSK